MDILEAIKGRQSIRAFLDTPVSDDLVHTILEAARFAPSGANMQPWFVTVIGPVGRQAIFEAIVKAREAGMPENPDYQYYPIDWKSPYTERRKACGAALYGALNINIEDKKQRKEQWYKNYSFFGAPVGLLFWVPKSLAVGSWVDTALFIQTVMLAARGVGLETCPQASLSEYPSIVRSIVKQPEEYALICGMALGYADWNNPVNQYRPAREPVDSFCRWID